MNNQIVIGALAGLVLGVIEFFLFGAGSMYLYIVLPVILGAVIGFAGTQTLKINYYLLGALVGALFFIILGASSGGTLADYADEIITGAVTGLALAFIIQFLNKQLSK
ncbi:hypothetical protein C7N43_07450 [Sphingobacteriales bacterium UPWRP_1]|nr:hypothetical protein B6N25_05295 [Sphingobacteriales bacterium TSM_CSS]PSJ77707.1 hypothetical protein C7N43_07450 [Sphingobacteriales bacterium UPWRP_1]